MFKGVNYSFLSHQANAILIRSLLVGMVDQMTRDKLKVEVREGQEWRQVEN